MVEAVLDIKQWGNNLGVRLPAAVAQKARRYVEMATTQTLGAER
jgi:antitoxin MazE